MNRRDFLQSTTAGISLLSAGAYAYQPAQKKPRVGLIGCGWYGKCDLFRLIQVAPVEVVSLCDVDKKMLAEAADLVSQRQASKKTPRTYGDYRQMLKEKRSRHRAGRHARSLARAADDRRRRGRAPMSTCQKPISVDVVEGQAMLAAARKHNRVVQVGTQRRSTPHLVEARDRDHQGRIAGQDRPGGGVLLLPHAGPRQSARFAAARSTSTTRCGPAPRRCGPTTRWSHPRRWRAFMEYGNGIMGDMCIHMFDMVRWMLGLGWPKRISSTGGILVQKESKANITDTQIGHVRLRRSPGRLAAPHVGTAGRPELSLGAHDLRRQGHAQAQRATLRLHSRRQEGADAIGRGPVRDGPVSGRQDGEGPGAARGVGQPPASAGFPAGDRVPRQAGGRYRRGLHLQRLLHPGQPLPCSSAARWPGIPRNSKSPAMRKPIACCVGPTARRGFIPSRRTCSQQFRSAARRTTSSRPARAKNRRLRQRA